MERIVKNISEFLHAAVTDFNDFCTDGEFAFLLQHYHVYYEQN